jgi:hypothetical protein
MAATVANVPVYSEAQLEQAITSYIVQGYALSNRTPTSATMFKRKEFSILWLVIGLLLCLIPLIIYLFMYAAASDKMVQIYLAGAAPSPAVSAASGQISPDGRWRWDGSQWTPVSGFAPATLPQDSGPTQSVGPPAG